VKAQQSHAARASPRPTTLRRWALAGVVVLALGAAVLALRDPPDPGTPPDPGAPQDRTNKESDAGRAVVRAHKPSAVPANRGAGVPDGFRGDVHPLLHGRTQLGVAAHWTAVERGQLKLEAPESVQSWYTGLRPAVPQATYTERDFSAFLPESVADVGQLWALDPDKIKTFLRQFHPNPSSRLVATGRRAGPDGAFAILRAVSPSHLDIVFRVHAEFFITPEAAGDLQLVYAWYTPAYFSGRVLVNKTTGQVEHFRFALPTEKALNVFLTVNPSLLGIPKLGHDIVRVERMELSGGDGRLGDDIAWAKSLPPAEAGRRLARVFYKFEEIDWVPFDQVLARARGQSRPIFAIVSWGATDDQSC
jgi:hypothetical protein